jgi:hypothetical protein
LHRPWSLEPPRRMLLSAWADLGIGSYEWAVYKAWRAAASALASLYGGLGPLGWGSTGYMTAGLQPSCPELGGLWRCASRLDALAAPLRIPEIESLLGVELGYTRATALDAIECSLKILSRLSECGRGAEASIPAGLLSRELERLKGLWDEASLAVVGGVYLLAVGEARGKRYAERVEMIADFLPPAALVVLSPEEAAIILGLPSWSAAGISFERDDYGLEAASSARLLDQA